MVLFGRFQSVKWKWLILATRGGKFYDNREADPYLSTSRIPPREKGFCEKIFTVMGKNSSSLYSPRELPSRYMYVPWPFKSSSLKVAVRELQEVGYYIRVTTCNPVKNNNQKND